MADHLNRPLPRLKTIAVLGFLLLLSSAACGGGFDPESRLVDVGLYLELAKRREATLATLDAGLARAAISEGLEVPSR